MYKVILGCCCCLLMGISVIQYKQQVELKKQIVVATQYNEKLLKSIPVLTKFARLEGLSNLILNADKKVKSAGLQEKTKEYVYALLFEIMTTAQNELKDLPAVRSQLEMLAQ